MGMSLIVRNSAANFLGQLISKGLRIILVPLQINLLGDQAFGLVGFYSLVLGLVAFLDLGLSLTANREVARLTCGSASNAQGLRNLVRTFEIPYWTIGGLIGAMVLAYAGWFSDHWITAPDLPHSTIVSSVSIIGLILAVRWPVSLYRGVLFGLQHQIQVNLLGISMEILTGVGSVLVVVLYPSLEAFFIWLLLACLVEIAGYVWYCWHILRDGSLPRPHFRWSELKRTWRFALGVNATAMIASILGRADGLILSKLLPISHLGYYSIAQRVTPLIGMFPTALINATTPSFVSQHEQGEHSQMSRLYRRQTRWLSFVGTGSAAALAAFAYPILQLWTQSESIATITALPFAIVSAATALDVMSGSVRQFSLSCGFTGPPLVVGSLAGMVVAAGTFVLAPSLGICGAALAWGAARVLSYVLFPLLVHRVVLPGYARAWFLCDTLPLLTVGGLCFGGGGLLYHLLAASTHNLLWIPLLGAAGLLYVGVALRLDLIPDWRNLVRLRPVAV